MMGQRFSGARSLRVALRAVPVRRILLGMPVDQIELPIESFTVRSADGLLIRAHKVGTGPHRWLLPPGMGTPLLCWKYVMEAFAPKMTIVTWDQRGTYDSEAPSTPDGLAIERHVDDGLAVLESLDWGDEPFVTGGWSMGVQIGLEIYRRMPQRIAGLTLINGAAEHPLKTAYGPALTRPLLAAVLRGLVVAAPKLNSLWGPLCFSGYFGRLVMALRVARANEPFVTAVTQELARMDLQNYLQILVEADKHSAWDVLNDIQVPTLITAGTKDVATPPRVAKRMLAEIPWSDYVEIEGGTHYSSLEYPDKLNEALERFFAFRLFKETWSERGHKPKKTKGSRVKRRRAPKS
jgi:pimeloyl-ACP methyl ester carboxylesterase